MSGSSFTPLPQTCVGFSRRAQSPDRPRVFFVHIFHAQASRSRRATRASASKSRPIRSQRLQRRGVINLLRASRRCLRSRWAASPTSTRCVRPPRPGRSTSPSPHTPRRTPSRRTDTQTPPPANDDDLRRAHRPRITPFPPCGGGGCFWHIRMRLSRAGRALPPPSPLAPPTPLHRPATREITPLSCYFDAL